MTSKVIEEETFVEKKVPRKTTPYASNYEYAAIVAAHTLKLTSKKTLPVIDPSNYEYNMMTVAEMEIDHRKENVNLAVRRHLPDGSFEDWHVNELIFPPK